MSKHLILIHGRSTKPQRAEHEAFILRSMHAGMNRVDSLRREAFVQNVKFSFAYYGYLNNEVMARKESYRKRMVKGPDGRYYERAEEYERDLDLLLERPTSTLDRDGYTAVKREYPDLAGADDALRIVSAILSPFNLNERVVRKLFPDLAEYYESRKFGSAIRFELQRYLEPALLAGDDILLVAHSMGSLVAYDVLWKFSHMSEYRELRENGTAVSTLLTLGSPLGEPGVRNNLYDSNEPRDGMYPTNIKNWLNFSAVDDMVSHDSTLGDDFREMIGLRYVDEIVDREIYNLWVGRGESNPHKLYGYLDHPDVARAILEWAEE